jgi:hypothetical protein
MEIDFLIFWIVYVFALGFGFIIVYRLMFWKAKIYILDKYEKTYFLSKTKSLYSYRNDVSIDGSSYILDKPTYFVGSKRVYFFEKHNSKPLSFNDVETLDAKKLDIILNAKIIEQLARGVRGPSFDAKTLMYIVIIAIVIIAFFYFFPTFISPTTTTTTVTTTATPISPIKP